MNDQRRDRKDKHLTKMRCNEELRAKKRQIHVILKKCTSDQTEEDLQLLKESKSLVELVLTRKQRLELNKERIKEVEDEPQVLTDKCHLLSKLIRESKGMVVYTGAGISTSAQIPDYRVYDFLFLCITSTDEMGRVRTKTIKKASRVIIEKYYTRLTIDFHTNKRICEEIAIIPSKRLRNQIAGFVTHLMRRIQRAPIRGISIKLQEEERERRDNYVPDVSAIDMDVIEVDPDSFLMLKEMAMDKISGLQQTNPTVPFRGSVRP
ncbi:unnamed protein product [Medioppia subpectinata]|uniref:Small ribosomal subunit protein eS17 n=2 Tax=Medioppia subpectinata TaxID=1979941 RepID=A0A7R9L8A6_9ACAR|nr:unnamed protein product [Medioppia subpectinata]CAG2116815.1 unnamed protein product [Medioppia subpectinata]